MKCQFKNCKNKAGDHNFTNLKNTCKVCVKDLQTPLEYTKK